MSITWTLTRLQSKFPFFVFFFCKKPMLMLWFIVCRYENSAFRDWVIIKLLYGNSCSSIDNVSIFRTFYLSHIECKMQTKIKKLNCKKKVLRSSYSFWNVLKVIRCVAPNYRAKTSLSHTWKKSTLLYVENYRILFDKRASMCLYKARSNFTIENQLLNSFDRQQYHL